MSDSLAKAQEQLCELGYMAMCGDKIAALVLSRLGRAQEEFLKQLADRLFNDGFSIYRDLLTSD